jgi:hypothetical protein
VHFTENNYPNAGIRDQSKKFIPATLEMKQNVKLIRITSENLGKEGFVKYRNMQDLYTSKSFQVCNISYFIQNLKLLRQFII